MLHPVCSWKIWILKKTSSTLKKKPKKRFDACAFYVPKRLFSFKVSRTQTWHIYTSCKCACEKRLSSWPPPTWQEIISVERPFTWASVNRTVPPTRYWLEDPAYIWRRLKKKASFLMDCKCFLNIELSVIYVCCASFMGHCTSASAAAAAGKPEAANHLHGNNAHVQTHLLEE